MDDGVDYAVRIFGALPVYEWHSYESEDWQGPPCVVLFFVGVPPTETPRRNWLRGSRSTGRSRGYRDGGRTDAERGEAPGGRRPGAPVRAGSWHPIRGSTLW
jgi:hypothetical protein